MLLQLDIRNVALIDQISIEFGQGLNIMTGETGAGKSIIIDSINAILGGRLSKDMIRTGTEKAAVEAVFQMNNTKLAELFENLGMEPEEDGTLIISREFSITGKNICRVNGKMVTASVLKEIGERIIDVHGQYDNQSLLRTESHIGLLDSFGGEKIQALKSDYLETLGGYKGIRQRLKQLSGDRNERERKIDLLKFQVDEIKKAKLKINEEEELNRQRVLLANSEKIMGALNRAYGLLFSGVNVKSSAADSMSEALADLSGIAKLNEKYGAMAARLEELSYHLEDVIEELRREKDQVEYNPDLLEKIEERMDVLYKLKRKYGKTVGDVLEYCGKAEAELDEIMKSEETAAELHKQLDVLENKLYHTAKKINEERVKAAAVLEERIGAELGDLEMRKAQFKASIEFDDPGEAGERKYTGSGLDRVEFLISPNAGEPMKPLSKIASGGEMSRVMLAIKTILANVDDMPTLIFDEIDIGISGKAAQKIGEKLSYISRNHQVICVTHLAQIASMADLHYLIEKVSDEDSTRTRVERLGEEAARSEIARILGGAVISAITLKYAEEMLENAKEFKKG